MQDVRQNVELVKIVQFHVFQHENQFSAASHTKNGHIQSKMKTLHIEIYSNICCNVMKIYVLMY